MAQPKKRQGAGLLGGSSGVGLGGPAFDDSCDFCPHDGPVGDVMMAQGNRLGDPGEFGVVAQPRLRRLQGAEPFEVHSKSGDIIEHIHPPQAVVEVQAVKSPGAISQAEDVFGQQVPVPVSHQSRPHARAKQRLPTGDVAKS